MKNLQKIRAIIRRCQQDCADAGLPGILGSLSFMHIETEPKMEMLAWRIGLATGHLMRIDSRSSRALAVKLIDAWNEMQGGDAPAGSLP